MLRAIALSTLMLSATFVPTAAPAQMTDGLENAVEQARALERMHSLIVAQNGQVLVEEAFRGQDLNQPVNVKSVSKTILSALVGAAIERSVLEGADQPIAPLLSESMPDDPDPRLEAITVGNLLSMQAGLERTSGANYGAWVTSADWVGYALSRPFVDEPGGQMLYSTGSSHLVSAILTRESGRSTHALMRDWLGEPLGMTVPEWPRDPQGVYFGGNDMLLSPRGLLRFAEMYRNGGVHEDAQVIPAAWIETSWQPRTRSRYTGHDYGYGWFAIQADGHDVYYGWGYGGQMLYVIPELGASVIITSDATAPSGSDGYARQLHQLLRSEIVPALARRQAEEEQPPS